MKHFVSLIAKSYYHDKKRIMNLYLPAIKDAWGGCFHIGMDVFSHGSFRLVGEFEFGGAIGQKNRELFFDIDSDDHYSSDAWHESRQLDLATPAAPAAKTRRAI